MRIATYNVLAFKGYPQQVAAPILGAPDSPERIAHFVGALKQLDCDVLCLQEGVAAPVIQAIARELGMYLATIPSPRNWPGHVLSRVPIIESRVFGHLDPHNETPPFSRAVGAVRLQWSSEREIWVVPLHLHPSDASLRKVEGEMLDDKIGELLRLASDIVVLGDFNCGPGEDVHLRLKARGFVNVMDAVGGGIETTFDSSGKHRRALDHIYVSPGLAGDLSRAYVVRDPGFSMETSESEESWVHSDHMPVVAQLELDSVSE